MSDIPIGSPPVPPGRHAAPSGWYPDPVDTRRERYWDGWQWTRNVRTAAQPAHPPSSPRPGGPASAGTQSTLAADGRPLAGWGTRLAAMILDWIAFYLIASVLTLLLPARWTGRLNAVAQQMLSQLEAGQQVHSAGGDLRVVALTSAAVLAALYAYHVLFTTFLGATPGKLALGLRVVPATGTSRSRGLPWRAALVRAAVWVVPQLTCLLWIVTLIDGLYPLWQPRRQALHDLAARTQVITIRPTSASRGRP